MAHSVGRKLRSLCLLVENAPGNGKKVTLDWYVDCEIYKKHQYIGWGVELKWQHFTQLRS